MEDCQVGFETMAKSADFAVAHNASLIPNGLAMGSSNRLICVGYAHARISSGAKSTPAAACAIWH